MSRCSALQWLIMKRSSRSTAISRDTASSTRENTSGVAATACDRAA